MSIKNKIISISPLVSMVIFLVLGFADDFGFATKPLWHPGWVIFLLTPLVSTILKMKIVRASISMVIFVIYIVLGAAFSLWHPGWIIFLLIPILDILIVPSKKTKRMRWSYININEEMTDKETNKEEDE